MKITFYTNESSNNTLNKNIAEKLNIDVTFKNDFDLVSPVFLMSNIDFNKDNINYCYIEELKRFYFISSWSLVRNDLIQVSLQTDYLMTYKDVVLNATGEIIETENKNLYTGKLKTTPILKEKSLYFPNNNLFSEKDFTYLSVVN